MAGPSEDAPSWVAIARVVKTQGRRGEVAAEILSDVPGRFGQVPEVSLYLPATGLRRAAAVRGHWFHKGLVVLQLEGLDDSGAAEAWIGAEVQVPRAQRPPAPAGTVYVSDLVGCEVVADGRALGAITGVEEVPGAPPLLHVGEVLIPFVEAYVVRLDVDARRLELALPEGLLEI